ncbi:hypothetical protein E2C01_050786 [Portunus trituberculatus]|uniref:Uncharacterized protein n=1 Tax=Portunus trituberculatus TaxID=210409 RepID=A0A5B7G985_PORTR|nr:hypothetical protein [Portunus trituberculatus]
MVAVGGSGVGRGVAAARGVCWCLVPSATAAGVPCPSLASCSAAWRSPPSPTHHKSAWDCCSRYSVVPHPPLYPPPPVLPGQPVLVPSSLLCVAAASMAGRPR